MVSLFRCQLSVAQADTAIDPERADRQREGSLVDGLVPGRRARPVDSGNRAGPVDRRLPNRPKPSERTVRRTGRTETDTTGNLESYWRFGVQSSQASMSSIAVSWRAQYGIIPSDERTYSKCVQFPQ